MASSLPSTAAAPAAASAPPPDRLAGLSPQVADLLRRTSQHLRAGQLPLAEQALAGAEALAPTNVEVRRTRGLLLNHAGRHAEARALIERLLEECPDDPALLNDLAGSARGCGDYDAAFAAWRRACELQPDFTIGWFNLARHLKEQAWIEESLPALERTVALAPDHLLARTMYADVLVHLGELERARAEYLEVLRRAPKVGPAWWGLANIKTVRFSEDETRRLAELVETPQVGESDRIGMGYALAKAYEDHGRYVDAFETLTRANRRLRALKPWNAAHFSAAVEAMLARFRQPHPHADDARLGEEVIFVVSLPRSGSTLTEQILA
ncbi:MAG TPA: tetratricopeptide repeat protein, partial [Dokdonella sp.]